MEANEQALLIQEYAKSTTYCHSGEIYNAHRHQGNSICGDDITIYLYIVDDKVVKYSFDGNTSMITYASASFLGDLIVGATIGEVTKRTEKTMLANDFVVSMRRRRASVIALLSCHNAIYQYLGSDLKDSFDDLLDGYDEDREL